MFANLPFMLYAMETEGLINTPRGKRQKFIKDVRSGVYGVFTPDQLREEAAAAGFDSCTIEIILQELQNTLI